VGDAQTIAPDETAPKPTNDLRGLPTFAWFLWSLPMAFFFLGPVRCVCAMTPVMYYILSFLFWVWVMLPFRLIAAHIVRSPLSTWIFYICFMILIGPFAFFVLPFVYVLLVPWLNPDLMHCEPFV